MALFEDLGPQDVMSAITSSPLVDVKFDDEDLYRMCLRGITVPTVSCPPIVLLDDTSMRKALSTRISMEMRHFPDGAYDVKVYRAFVLALGSLLSQLRRSRSSSNPSATDTATAGTLDACHRGFSAIYQFTPSQAEKFKALLDSHPDVDTIDIPAGGFVAPPVTAATLHTAAMDMLTHLSSRTHFYSRGDEIMLAVAALMVLQDTHVLQQVPKGEVHLAPDAPPVDLPDELIAYAPIVMNGVDALTRIRRSLTLVSARAVRQTLTQDTGFFVRRLLHHGIRLQAVASTCSIDAVSLEAKRSSNGMATVVAFGCPVRSGRWYFEATVLHKDMMQVRILVIPRAYLILTSTCILMSCRLVGAPRGRPLMLGRATGSAMTAIRGLGVETGTRNCMGGTLCPFLTIIFCYWLTVARIVVQRVDISLVVRFKGVSSCIPVLEARVG
jgi:hypothetical protein